MSHPELRQREKLQMYVQEIAKIFYADANPEKVKTLARIEETIR